MPDAPAKTKAVAVPVYRKQLDFLRSKATYRGFVGGRGAGKTFVGAYDLIKRAKADRFYIAAAPTIRNDVKDTTCPTFKLVCKQIGRKNRINKTDFRGWFETADGGKATISFRSTEDPESLRGPNVSGLWMDEASLMVEDAYTIGIATLREGGEAGWLSATFTPKGKGHWTYKKFADGAVDAELVQAKMKENPFLSPEFIENMLRQYGNSSLAAQELEGLFVDFEGQLIKWDWTIQCQHPQSLWPVDGQQNAVRPAATSDLFIGIDFGLTRDLTVIWTWERLGDIAWCREIKTMKAASTGEQKKAIKDRLSRHVVKCSMDAGAQGQPLAMELSKEHPGVMEMMHLSQPTQVRLAEGLRVAFEEKRIRIPDSEILRDDIQLVTLSKNGTIETGRKSSVGHADRFWAAALGYDAAHWVRPVRFGAPMGVATR